jgi:hypothetical protein
VLVFFAVFVGFRAGSTFAAGAPPRGASATSAGAVAGQGNSETGSQVAANPEREEHGLSQRAVEITRLFGFPITNSMIVSWIVALGHHSSSGRYTEYETSTGWNPEFPRMAG